MPRCPVLTAPSMPPESRSPCSPPGSHQLSSGISRVAICWPTLISVPRPTGRWDRGGRFPAAALFMRQAPPAISVKGSVCLPADGIGQLSPSPGRAAVSLRKSARRRGFRAQLQAAGPTGCKLPRARPQSHGKRPRPLPAASMTWCCSRKPPPASAPAPTTSGWNR